MRSIGNEQDALLMLYVVSKRDPKDDDCLPSAPPLPPPFSGLGLLAGTSGDSGKSQHPENPGHPENPVDICHHWWRNIQKRLSQTTRTGPIVGQRMQSC